MAEVFVVIGTENEFHFVICTQSTTVEASFHEH